MKKNRLTRLMMSLLLLSAPIARAQQLVTLEQCRQMAVSHNKTLLAEEQKGEAAKAKRSEVRTNYFPQVSVNAGVMRLSEPFRLVDWDYHLGCFSRFVPSKIKDLTTIHPDNMAAVSLMAVQPLYMGGKIYHGDRMATAAVSLTEAMAETKRTEVETEVEETYWQMVSLASKKNLVSKLVELLEDAKHNVDLAVEEGVATKADGLAIRVKLSEAEVQLNKINNGLKLTSMLLAQQCGMKDRADYMPVDVLLFEKIEGGYTPQPLLIDTLDLDRYVRARSEVRSLLLADDIFAHKVKMTQADMLPKVVLMGGYTSVKPNPFTAPRDRLDGSWVIGLGVNVPITGIFSGYQKQKQARSEQIIKQIELEDAEEKIRLQMRQALLNRSEALLDLDACNKALEFANENLHYARVGYREGVIPLLDLTTAQTAWAKAHDAYIDAYVKVKKNENSIEHIFPDGQQRKR